MSVAEIIMINRLFPIEGNYEIYCCYSFIAYYSLTYFNITTQVIWLPKATAVPSKFPVFFPKLTELASYISSPPALPQHKNMHSKYRRVNYSNETLAML